MIELNKRYQTRDGREVRIYAVDGEGSFPVHGAIRHESSWRVAMWMADGISLPSVGGNKCDLVPVPEKRTLRVWINAYDEVDARFHFSRQSADSGAYMGRIACIEREITYTVGEGL